MRSRYARTVKTDIPLNDGDLQGFIERVRKARALNCNPADVGIDSFVWKMLSVKSRSGRQEDRLRRIF